MTDPGLRALLGINVQHVSWTERLVSGLGGLLGILAVLLISRQVLGPDAAIPIVASMGASAVLLFAVPHGALSQPWPLVGGHLISAIIGVACAKLVAEPLLAAPLAVGGAILAMHLLHCIHPPGGATALTAVVAGPAVSRLGWEYVLDPVLLNLLVLGGIAVLFNALFAWRRYPAALQRHETPKAITATEPEGGQRPISHEDFVYALSEIDSFVDIDEQDLLRIYELATSNRQRRALTLSELGPGRYYSNGRHGDAWSVRLILEIDAEADPDRRGIIYKNVAGSGDRSTASCSINDFIRWAQYEVYREESNWRRRPASADS